MVLRKVLTDLDIVKKKGKIFLNEKKFKNNETINLMLIKVMQTLKVSK